MESASQKPNVVRSNASSKRGAAARSPDEISETLPELPDIFGFLDYRAWLRERIKYNQAVNSRHSQRWLAKRAGFNSLQLLSMILQGKRNLTADKVGGLAEALKLNDQETAYFRALVDLAGADSHDQQQAILEQIKVNFQNGLFAPISDAGVEIFREWYFPAIREIVTVRGFRDDAAWIAARLNISEEQAADALATLLRHGFLTRTEGRLTRSEPSVRTERSKIYPLFLANYHMMMFERAFQAVRLPREKRHIEGLTIALSKDSLRQLREMIQKFFREVDFVVESQSERDEIFHLELGLFALTQMPSPTETAQTQEKSNS